jgi:uncharacterized small protein (DUF1192 family)
MTDIVDELRGRARFGRSIFNRAADEIERLRADRARHAIDSYKSLRDENVRLRAELASADDGEAAIARERAAIAADEGF